MFNEAEITYCIVVYEVQVSAMIVGVGSVAHMEVALFFTVRGGGCKPDRLECASEGMVCAYEMCMIQAQGRSEGWVDVTKEELQPWGPKLDVVELAGEYLSFADME